MLSMQHFPFFVEHVRNPRHGAVLDAAKEIQIFKVQTRLGLGIIALAGNPTQVNCLEGSYAHHYTTNATETKIVHGIIENKLKSRWSCYIFQFHLYQTETASKAPMDPLLTLNPVIPVQISVEPIREGKFRSQVHSPPSI